MRIFLFFAAFCAVSIAIAQERSSLSAHDFQLDSLNKGHNSYVELKIHSGGMLQGTKYLSDYFEQGHLSGELRLGFQSSGRQKWQRTWNYPTYGIGFFAGNMKASETLDSIIGTPAGIFGFIGMPWYRSQNQKFRFNTDLAVGLSYGFTPYDLTTNPYNDVIGTRVNVYFNLQLATYYQISDRMDLNLGAGLIHFSNGRWRTPNLGINLVGINVGVAYHFNPVGNFYNYNDTEYSSKGRTQFIVMEDEESPKLWELDIVGSIGTNSNKPPKGLGQVEGMEGNSFFASTFTVDVAHRFWERGKVVAGMDVMYDASLGETYGYVANDDNGDPIVDGNRNYVWIGTHPHDVELYQKTNIGLHVGHDLLIERFTLVTQFGVYVYKQSPQRGGWYLRAGGKIDVSDHLFVNITLKTQNGGISDWVEWGLGYRIFKN